jgi:hypothetical protein
VIARSRDYVPDSGRFDVSVPGTPYAQPDLAVDLKMLIEARRRRRVPAPAVSRGVDDEPRATAV